MFSSRERLECESYALGITKCSVENFSKENVQVEPKKLGNKHTHLYLAVIYLYDLGILVGKLSISDVIMRYLGFCLFCCFIFFLISKLQGLLIFI